MGAVIRKDRTLRTYDDLLADVVVRANIELDPETVGRFLRDSGYIVRAVTGRQINAVIALAKVRG